MEWRNANFAIRLLYRFFVLFKRLKGDIELVIQKGLLKIWYCVRSDDWRSFVVCLQI